LAKQTSIPEPASERTNASAPFIFKFPNYIADSKDGDRQHANRHSAAKQ
jgi:hypothetical protein